MSSHVVSEIVERVLSIQFNRPDRKNALTAEMYDSASRLLHEADSNDDVKVIVLSGADNAFTAGNDMQEFLDGWKDGDEAPPMAFLKTLHATEKPVIAAVSGAAIGIGTTLLLHCDLVVVAEDARFQLPFVNLGLCPEAGSSLLLPASAGFHLASELFLTGRPFGAETAWRCGIVNKIVAPVEVEREAKLYAGRIASMPLASIILTKKLLKEATRDSVTAVMDIEADHFEQRMKTPEAKEAFTAFLEKRPPDFSRY